LLNSHSEKIALFIVIIAMCPYINQIWNRF